MEGVRRSAQDTVPDVDKRTYDAVMGLVLRSTTRGHRVLHRVSGGRLGRRFPGGQRVVWISTLGRKSGTWRKSPLLSMRDGDAADAPFVVTGSNAGQAKVPGWVFNARANPEGYVEIDGAHFRATFTEAVDADRDALYERLTSMWSAYATYEDHAGRYIPVFRVVVGEPVPAADLPDRD